MPAHTGRLLLVPQDPFHLPERAVLVKGLAAGRFLGDPLPGRANAFAVGADFLQLISFAGCSVQLNLSPDNDNAFCHLLVSEPHPQPRFIGGRNTRPPRCRACRGPLASWRDRLAQWQSGAVREIECDTCGLALAPWELDWKESAGFGRLFVQVEEVFPGEAAPTPGMMLLLETITGREWRHFYVQDP
ncbi:MAG: hypothetical protein WCA32_07560 [Chromatiaceae bacterium]